MGKARYIYISDENNDRLENINNMSQLINSLLDEHFRKTELQGMNKEELKKFIAKEKIKKEMMQKMKEVDNGKY